MLSNKKYIYFCKKNSGFISDTVNLHWNTGRQKGCAGKHIYRLICKKMYCEKRIYKLAWHYKRGNLVCFEISRNENFNKTEVGYSSFQSLKQCLTSVF